MKKILFALLTFVSLNTFAAVNFIGQTLVPDVSVTLWFNADTNFGQGFMAQIRYQIPSTGPTNQFTGFINGSFDATNGPAGSNWKVVIPVNGQSTVVAGQVPFNATSMNVEGAKQGTSGNQSTGFEYTGFPGAWVVNGPLPVVLTKFSGKQLERSIALAWETSSEVGNDYFAVQHSRDLKSWEALGEIQGKGSIDNNQAYAFAHAAPQSGQNYYRLKQVDFNGNYEFSKAISVLMPSNPELAVYPNPVEDFIQISGVETASQLQVIDGAGKVILEQKITENTTIPLKTSSGVYYIKVFDNISSQSKKVLVK